MVNDLHQASVAGSGKQAIAPMLERLADYTAQHFAMEEEFRARIQYPHLEMPRRKHAELAQKAARIIGDDKTGKAVLSITLSQFLADWLRHHINEDDKALIRYTQSMGIQS